MQATIRRTSASTSHTEQLVRDEGENFCPV